MLLLATEVDELSELFVELRTNKFPKLQAVNAIRLIADIRIKQKNKIFRVTEYFLLRETVNKNC